jgi:hypothetical protein
MKNSYCSKDGEGTYANLRTQEEKGDPAPIAPKFDSSSFITIGSAKVPIINDSGPLLLRTLLHQQIQMMLQVLLAMLRKSSVSRGIPSTYNPSGVLLGCPKHNDTNCNTLGTVNIKRGKLGKTIKKSSI